MDKGRIFQAKKTASANAMRQDCTSVLRWLEWTVLRGNGVGELEEGAGPTGPCKLCWPFAFTEQAGTPFQQKSDSI